MPVPESPGWLRFPPGSLVRGEAVRLASGGPEMRVLFVFEVPGAWYAHCHWAISGCEHFDQRTLRRRAS